MYSMFNLSIQDTGSGDTAASADSGALPTRESESPVLGSPSERTKSLSVSSLLSADPSSTSSASSPLRWRRRSQTQAEIKTTLDASLTEDARLNQYTLLKTLGRGAHGLVHLAVDSVTQKQFAIKEFSKARLLKHASMGMLASRGRGRPRSFAAMPKKSPNPLSLVQTEVAIFKKLNHVNVVKLFEVLDNPGGDSLYMVFECCENGPILDLTADPCLPYSESDARRLFQQIILGIEYLHANGISHRDIKPDNLLLAAGGTLKIVDFGVSEMFGKDDDVSKKSAGSPAFFSPELCIASYGDIHAKACDIWAIGVTLYSLIYACLPFTGKSVLELYDSIRACKPVYFTTHSPRAANVGDSRLSPVAVSAPLIDLLSRFFAPDPDKRITIAEIRQHEWTGGEDSLPSALDNCVGLVTYVTEEEIEASFKRVNDLFTVLKAVRKLKRLSGRSSASNSTDSVIVASPSGEKAPEIPLPVNPTDLNMEGLSVRTTSSPQKRKNATN